MDQNEDDVKKKRKYDKEESMQQMKNEEIYR